MEADIRKMSKAKIILTFILCASLGCTMTAEGRADKTETARYHYEVSRDRSVYFTNADVVIEKIRKALVERHSDITISYTSESDDLDDISAIVSELMGFAVYETDRPYEGDYLDCTLGGHEVDYSCTKSAGRYDYEIVIKPIYYTDEKQEKRVDAEVRRIAHELGLYSEKADEQKIRLIYDYICKNVSYDLVNAKNEHSHLRSTAFAALIYHSATCQGYAHAIYRLMREAGIECRIIRGMCRAQSGEYEYHAWNIAKLQDKWYELDATWDAGRKEYSFFLMGSRDFARHTRDEEYLTEEFEKSHPMAQTKYIW